MEQVGATVGDQTYCVVSGVVFEVKGFHRTRKIDGRAVYFCCDGCSAYFDEHRDAIIVARGY